MAQRPRKDDDADEIDLRALRQQRPISSTPVRRGGPDQPPLRVMTTTLWSYPSQHYVGSDGRRMQGDKDFLGATPSWVIWQVLSRYTREGDTIVDPFCGSGTTLDVCHDLKRKGRGFDLASVRPDIESADARALPLESESVDFIFMDPPYGTHIAYSDHGDCIGRLGGGDYLSAMDAAIAEAHRVLRNRRYMAIYVSDSWKKKKGGPPGSGAGTFLPIGFELWARLTQRFSGVDIICVERRNAKLAKGNWNKVAEEENFFLRGFNYLLIVKKTDPTPAR
ncbi:MAG: DNA methyltransferase [Planctomycetota bacterium]|nr:DNA methyltransferase [Planctomycetota bacterium]